MVLQSNPRKRRAMAKGEGLGMGNKAGTGRSLYRPYNLNFVKDLGACCKQVAQTDVALKAAVARYNVLEARINEMKDAHEANGAGDVKENVGEFGKKNYERDALTVKRLDGIATATVAAVPVDDKAKLKTLHTAAIAAIEDFRAELVAVTPVDPANNFNKAALMNL